MSLLATTLLLGCATREKTETAGENADTVATAPANNPAPVANPSNPAPADEGNATTIEWVDPVVKDLGNLKANQEVELTWKFRNTGDKPLVIEAVTAQCGCTIPEKPQQPFAPREEGVIKAKFDGKGSGTVSKQVYVVANTKGGKNHTLTFSGNIK